MTTTADSTTALADAITGMARAVRRIGGDGMRLEEVRSRRWQSPTFSGTRMELRFTAVTAADAARVAAGLDCADFAIPGHIVADVFGLASGRTVNVEALTVDDD